MQLEQFRQVKEEIVGMIGEDATMELLSKALVLIVSGSNDWLNTYLIRGSPLPKIYTIPQFRDVLLAKYLSQIKVRDVIITYKDSLHNLYANIIFLQELNIIMS